MTGLARIRRAALALLPLALLAAPAAAQQALTSADVQRVLAQAVAEAQGRGVPSSIAVVDRVGNVLAVFTMTNTPANATITSGRGVTTGLEGMAVPSQAAAIAKAITGAYLSSGGNAFTTRTANQIVQEHFNPGERGQFSGPLFGVQFSQLPCSDFAMRFVPGAANQPQGPKRSPLGLSAEAAALGAHRIAAANMIRAIKAVSTERGRDPRNYALFAFGGNGPLFATGMARELRMSRVVVPPSPGLFSSFGLLYADVEHHYGRTFRRLLTALDPAELAGAWAEMEADALKQLAIEGFSGGSATIERRASLHYKGQTWELTIAAPSGTIGPDTPAALAEGFGQEHERVYGHRAGKSEPVELVNIHVVGRGLVPGARVPDKLKTAAAARPADASRRAWFGDGHGWLDTPVLARADLATPAAGPCIVEEYDATCLVTPGATAQLDRFGNIVIDL